MADPIVLDTKGLRCPLPVLKARKALRDLDAGMVLRVLATDPGAIKDFEAFCKTTGHRLLAQSEAAGVLTFDIEKID
jgi:tRNA 2-thiouridine synthesizing protein A